MSRQMDKADIKSLFQDSELVIPFLVTGNSMAPFLISKRDTVYLKACTEMKKGDIVLYERENGELVLHRIKKIKGNELTLIGDGQQIEETGIFCHQVIAKVIAVLRKGKRIEPNDFWWFFFEKIWLEMIPLRTGIYRLFSKVR